MARVFRISESGSLVSMALQCPAESVEGVMTGAETAKDL